MCMRGMRRDFTLGNEKKFTFYQINATKFKKSISAGRCYSFIVFIKKILSNITVCVHYNSIKPGLFG